MESLFKLSVMVSAIDRLTGPVRRMIGTVTSLEKTMQRAKGVTEFGQRLGISGAMIAEGANKGKEALMGMAEPFAAVEDSLAWLSLSTTSTMGSMEKSMEESKKAAISWSKVHADNTRTFLESASVFSGAGLNDIQAIEGTRASLTLAKATMGTAAEASNALTDAYENFGDKNRDVATEMTRLADVMAMNQNLFKFKNLGQLTEGLRDAAPAALQSRASFEELNVVIGALNNTGLAGAPAGTAYAATMSQMTKASRDLGFEVARNENGGVSLIGTLENMSNKFGDLTMLSDDLKIAFQQSFGDEGLRLVMLLGGKVGKLKESMGEMDKAMGTAAAGQARMEKTSSNRWKIVMNNIENAKEMLGEKLAPVIDQTIPKVMLLVDKFAGFVEANPAMAQTIMIIAAIGTGLMMIVAPLLTVLSGFFILTGYGGMGFVKILQGITWVKAALSSGAIVARLISIGSGFKRVALIGWDLIRMASSLGLMLAKAAQMGIMSLYRSLLTAIPAVWSFTVALLSNPITWIIIGIVALGAAIYLCIKSWDDISLAATNAWNWIVEAFNNGLNYIQTSINDGLNWVQNMVSTFFNSGAALWGAFTDGIRSALSGPVEAVKEGLQWVRNLLPFSDAKEGPLSQLTRSGRALMSTLAEGAEIQAPNLRTTVETGLNIPLLKKLDNFKDLSTPSMGGEAKPFDSIKTLPTLIDPSLDIPELPEPTKPKPVPLFPKLDIDTSRFKEIISPPDQPSGTGDTGKKVEYHFHFGENAVVIKTDKMDDPNNVFAVFKQLAVEVGAG